MKRSVLWLPLILGGLLLLTSERGQAAAARDRFQGDPIFAPQRDLAVFQAQRGEDGEVLRTLEDAIQDKAYATIPAQRAYEIARLYADAAYSLGEWDRAHHAMVLAMRQPQSTREDWDLRFRSAILSGDAADAYLAFSRDIAHAPLQSLSGRQLERFDRLLGELPNAREARLALGREMEREDWQAPFVIYDPSRVWLDYALALQDSGDVAKARTVAAHVTEPTVIMAMASDSRFDGLVAATPALRDPDAAAQRYLAWVHAYAEANPRMLNGRLAVARALLLLGRPKDALPVLDEADRTIGHGPRREPGFDDLDERPLLDYWRSSVLIGLGRTDEGITVRMASAACGCSSLDAVMAAQALLDAGRAEEAQHQLAGATPDGLGPEDRMTLAQTRVCVAAARGHGAEAADSLAFLAAHEAWNPEARINALICAGPLDAAADAVVRQLADPQLRLDALAALQTYATSPGPPRHAALRVGWSKLAARQDVRAAVAKVGRLQSFKLERRGALV